MPFTITPFGDSAVMLRFGDDISRETNQLVQDACFKLEKSPFNGMKELIPAFSTLAVEYDPAEVGGEFPYETAVSHIEHALSSGEKADRLETRTIRIPVCYEEPYALDLHELAEHAGLTPEEVITIHTSADYYVYFLGFAPGFPFLGGMPESIAMPRKQTPREKISAGSVGIAGGQTGVYPISTPGGWQIIGRTPQALFTPDKSEPVLIKPGDTVQFYEITAEEYEQIESGERT